MASLAPTPTKSSDYPPLRGTTPLAMGKELRKAVGVIGELLAEKWRAERGAGKKKPANT